MNVRTPEKEKQAGVCYAVTDEGVELPVIDITHAAFALALSAPELAKAAERSVAEAAQLERMGWVRRLVIRWALRRSVLGRGIQDARGTFLSGMNTYLMKLGPENLGRVYSRPIDRRIAAAFPSLLMRLRLQDMARLLLDALSPALAANSGAPLHIG